MHTSNVYEIIVGSLVLLISVFFLVFSIRSSDFVNNGYKIIAKFDNIEGISEGSPVQISGIKIGSVKKIYLNKDDFQAVVELSILNEISIPIDSSARILTSGLLGKKFISIEIGSEEEFLKTEEEIEFTQSSINLEELLGKFMFKQ